ncbi:hypothetical protein QUC31_009800 [Theobroma cacao]
MAEAIVSAILLELAAIAIENAREEWRLVTGVDKEVERLKSNLEAIQCELEDAEEKQFINKRVQHWLDRFKQVAYDMEDVLDDWKTALDKLQTDGAETSSVPKRKVCPFVSCFSFGSQVARRHDIATRTKDINEELDKIAKDRVRTDLYGMPGSWILVTTRKESVARQMDLSHVFPLKQLPDEMCWSIIAQIAFTGENSDRRGNLEDIGREIAKKCKGPKGFPMSINSTEKLRSLVVVSLPDNGITNEALQNLFSQSKRLRLLELRLLLQGAEGICCEIGKLIHLRYLCLIDCTDIKYLPEALCELRNLRSLIIRFCPLLKKLPVGIGNLINLRYLSIERCRSVTYYPKGIGKLTSLMRLNRIIVRADRNDAEELSIGDLQHLDLLAGKIYVEMEGDAIDGDEAKRAKLHNKIHLKQMYISISPGIKEDKVVQALNPPSNLSVEIVDNQEDWIFRTIIVPLQSGQLGRLKTVISGSSEETAC